MTLATAAAAGLAAVVAAAFAAAVLVRARPGAWSPRLWGAGLLLYAFAAGAEAVAAASAAGWPAWLYRLYFPAAALLVGLLGAGTVALLGSRRATLAAVGVVAALGAVAVSGALAAPLAPADLALGAELGAAALPFPHPARVAFLLLNVLGGLALVGGALASWARSRRAGVLLIGLGALLPFVGGSLSTLEVGSGRVLLQLAGVSLMFAGYVLGRAAPGGAAAAPQGA